MHKIASPRDLQDELKALLAYAQTETPSRARIASVLNDLAERVAASTVTAANWWEKGEHVFEIKPRGKSGKEWKGTFAELRKQDLDGNQVYVKGPGHGEWTHISRPKG